MVRMIKMFIGGVVAVVIGGTTFAVSQADVVNNLSTNTGMSQEQAQQYVNDIPQSELASFDKIGQSFIDDGNSVFEFLPSIDCVNYVYDWETPAMSCNDGKAQLLTVANDEIKLGKCFKALDTNLGNAAKAKITECLSDINTVDSDFNLPVVTTLLDSKSITESKNTNAYKKSVLQAAIKSN